MNAISSRMSESLKKAATAALIALVAAGTTLSIGAQQAATAAKAPAPAAPLAKPASHVEEEETATAPKKPGHEGITVHGHWVMDLKDKDGKVIEHRDFQNSLDRNNGTNLLIQLLTGVVVGGNMEIDAIKSQSNNGVFSGGGVDYSMFPAGSNVSSATCTTGTSGLSNSRFCFPNMTTTIQHDPVDSAGTMILHGQFTAAADVVIDTVQTRNGGCFVTSGDFGPAQCAAGTNLPQYAQSIYVFTGTGIPPLTVLAGQTLAITVTISFS